MWLGRLMSARVGSGKPQFPHLWLVSGTRLALAAVALVVGLVRLGWALVLGRESTLMWQWGNAPPILQPQILLLLPSAQPGEPLCVHDHSRSLWEEAGRKYIQI